MSGFIDKIINKVGSDKILHLMGGFIISSGVILLLNNLMPLILLILLGIILTGIIEIIKERYLDSYFDKLDFLYTFVGSLIPLLLILLNKLLMIWLL